MNPFSDVVIAGASFAGLAVARELSGRTVLIDPEEVGLGQTSACGAPVSLLKALGALEAVQERHDALIIHTPGRDVSWPLPEPFCTFDYRACCRAALLGTGTPVMRASVHGRRGTAAVTSQGEVPARVLVDCTGWRAALAGPANGSDRSTRDLSGRYFGLESEAPAPFQPGLHFYFWPEIVQDGYGWAFPAGSATRIGVLSFRGRSHLGYAVAALLDRLGMPRGPVHGGFLRTGLRPPVADGVFAVGDAAGQCLPLTGEGIRTAIQAGLVCGTLLRSALDERITLGEAAARYRTFVLEQRRAYRVLEWATRAALVLPARLLGLIAAWVGRPGPLRAFMGHYFGLFAPPLGGAPGSGGGSLAAAQ